MASSKHDYVNYNLFTTNFDMVHKTIQVRVSLPNLKLFKQSKESYGPKKLENILLCYIEKLAFEHSFTHQHGCRK